MSFSLPEDVDPRERGGIGRVYLVEIGEIGYSVSVVESPEDVPTSYVRTVFDQLVAGLEGAGAEDVTLTALSAPKVAKGKALDGTLGFTATTGATNYWRMRAITSGRLVVQVQVLTFSDANHAAARKQVDTQFSRLAKSVVLD